MKYQMSKKENKNDTTIIFNDWGENDTLLNKLKTKNNFKIVLIY